MSQAIFDLSGIVKFHPPLSIFDQHCPKHSIHPILAFLLLRSTLSNCVKITHNYLISLNFCLRSCKVHRVSPIHAHSSVKKVLASRLHYLHHLQIQHRILLASLYGTHKKRPRNSSQLKEEKHLAKVSSSAVNRGTEFRDRGKGEDQEKGLRLAQRVWRAAGGPRKTNIGPCRQITTRIIRISRGYHLAGAPLCGLGPLRYGADVAFFFLLFFSYRSRGRG